MRDLVRHDKNAQDHQRQPDTENQGHPVRRRNDVGKDRFRDTDLIGGDAEDQIKKRNRGEERRDEAGKKNGQKDFAVQLIGKNLFSAIVLDVHFLYPTFMSLYSASAVDIVLSASVMRAIAPTLSDDPFPKAIL